MERGAPVVTGTETPRVLAGRYELGELLGEGGMAEVWAATDTRLRRPVAVKLLRGGLAADPKVRSRFEAEARAAARLSHPNVVAVYDTGEDDGTPFIVMERLPGKTLSDRLGTPQDAGFVVRLAGDVLGALGAAHAAGLVHRDVKPGNILLAEDGCAKVGDFGIAKSLENDDSVDLTRTDILIGTPAYLAPERIDGEDATPLSDLYSLGVVLYEALAGRRAYTGPTPMAVATAVKSTTPEPLATVRPDLDPRLVAAVEQAMATDPRQRFSSAAAMATALGSGLAGLTDTFDDRGDATVALNRPAPAAAVDPTTAMPSGPPPSAMAAPPLAGRRPPSMGWRILVAAASLLLLAGAAIAFRGDGGGGGLGGGTDAPSQERVALAAEMREWSEHLLVGDGPRGPEAAQRLRAVADAVESGGGVTEAETLAADVRAWRQANELFRTATNRTLELLAKVPGASIDAAAELPTTTAPPLVSVQIGGEGDDEGDDEPHGRRNERGDGKPKGGKGNKDD